MEILLRAQNISGLSPLVTNRLHSFTLFLQLILVFFVPITHQARFPQKQCTRAMRVHPASESKVTDIHTPVTKGILGILKTP